MSGDALPGAPLTVAQLEAIEQAWSDPFDVRWSDGAHVRALVDTLRAAWAENAELEASFDLRWKADMRAIARWREGHPERELRQPDHADLVLWLMTENERLRAALDGVFGWLANDHDTRTSGDLMDAIDAALAAPGAGGEGKGAT